MEYNKESNLNENDKTTLIALFTGMLSTLKHISVNKAIRYIQCLPLICRMHYNSIENRKIRNANKNKYHPIKPKRGEIYNAYITEGVGSELFNNHLVLIIQNKKGNIYGEKVNVLPIEGDGNKINPRYHVKLTNLHLESGRLDKDPSRIIITDITTLDKARLDRKIGKINSNCLEQVENLLRKQLDL